MAKEVPTEKQEPEKPPAKAKGMKMPLIIGIIGGVIVVQVLIVFILFKFVMAPNHADAATTDSARHGEVKHKAHERDPTEEEEFSEDKKLVDFYETGRITTNPKASSQFVVVNLGMVYKYKNEDVMKEKKGEGGPVPPKSAARIKGIVNSVLGNFTADELLNKRDSLSSVIKTSLKPVFREDDLFLKEVIVQEFILQ